MPGKVTAWCHQRGIAAIPVVDGLPSASWLGPLDPGGAWLGIGSSGRYLRRASVIIASSPGLRDAVVERWRIDPQRITVIGPAIDRILFSPRDQIEARGALGMAPEHRIVLAGDGLGRGPDLAPLIEAVHRAGDPALRLHVLGEGPRRMALERIADLGPSVTFHGTVSDQHLATFIAASDLCVSLEHSGESCYSLLECFSSARPGVVAAPSNGGPPRLQHGVTGFVVDHDVLAWVRFLQRDCPSRNTLRMMGMAASGTPIEDATRTAAAYLAVIDRVRRATPVLTVVV
jgi:glycosyltransferase involved in cell wall biosynthesis